MMNNNRDQLKLIYGKFFSDVSNALFQDDPIGINGGSNTDEYEPEAATIIPRLKSASSAQDVQMIVHEEFCSWFGRDVAGLEERYLSVSVKIWELWCDFKGQQA
jgi:hypothetical protein